MQACRPLSAKALMVILPTPPSNSFLSVQYFVNGLLVDALHIAGDFGEIADTTKTIVCLELFAGTYTKSANPRRK